MKLNEHDADDVVHCLKQMVALIQLGAQAKLQNEEMNIWSQMVPFLCSAQGILWRIENRKEDK